MQKEVEVISSNGKTIEKGKIVVSINYTTKKETVHNRGTHEEEEKQIPYSKVEAFREGDTEPLHSVETKGENHLLDHVKSMEMRLRDSLKLKAEAKEDLSTKDRLELLGYK